MKDVEEIEEIMDEEPTLLSIIKKEKMTLAEICESIEAVLRNQYIEEQTNWICITPPIVYISTLKLNSKNESDTVHRYSVAAFRLGEGDLEDLLIDKDTGFPIPKRTQRSLEACYFLTVLETDVINTGARLLDAIFRDTKRRLQHSEIRTTLNRDKNIIDSNIGLANMELTLC